MAGLTGPGAIFDSSIVIDALRGHGPAIEAIDEQGSRRGISIVSWIEVLAGPADGAQDAREFMEAFVLRQITPEVAEETAMIRREKRLKLPDAAILATARVFRCVIITRDEKAFANEPLARFPYRL